jgi:predicted ATPase/DNA-binding XRE family transcriptional regulator
MPTRVPVDIAQQIRRLRIERGLTQVDLGKLLGVSNVTVNRWERGRARPAPEIWRRVLALETGDGRDDARSAGARTAERNPLPVPLTSFIGRARALSAISALFKEARLITMTGPGGSGKTRLATAVAYAVRDRFPDDVWWIDLAGLPDPALLPETVAHALGARTPAGLPPIDRLTAACRPRTLLIVLDNCEHLHPACAPLVEALLTAAPDLRILATSRAPLGANGETIWPVPPLDLPDAVTTDPERIASADAVRLFIERARSRLPDMALAEPQVRAIGAICRHLDGLPLPIELAAARIPILSVEQIAARLSDQLRLLRTDRVTAPRRQQTMRAAFDWSYDLLSETERALFTRLAVFPGAFDIDAAEAIGGGGEIAPADVLDLLQRLVTQSLVTIVRAPSPAAGVARYRLLNPLRAYGRDRLSAEEEDAVAGRHAAYTLCLAEETAGELRGAGQAAALARLDAHRDDLRAALDWTIRQERATDAARIAAALEQFWVIRGEYAEGLAWMERILPLTAGLDRPVAGAGELHGRRHGPPAGGVCPRDGAVRDRAGGLARTGRLRGRGARP